MKDSFVFYTEYREAVSYMTNEQAGMLLKALIDYTDEKPLDITDQAVEMVFLTIKPRLDRDRTKWEEVIEKRKAAGRKSAEKRAEESQQESTHANTCQQVPTVSDSVSDADSVYNTPPKSPSRGKRESQLDMFDRLITGRAVTHDMEDVLREWIKYKNERNERYKEAGMRSLITQAVNHGAAHGGESVQNVIRESMANGYKGIVWDRVGKGPPGRKGKPPERDYDMDSLELKLLATN